MNLIILTLSLSFSWHVMIDPGHGGRDTGASYYGVKEADITLSVSNHLLKKLKATKGIEVSISRTKDAAIELIDRATAAHKAKADLFVSIHTNSSPEKRVQGLEVYIENVMPADQESLFLAYRENQAEGGATRNGGRPSQFRSNYSAEVSSILDDIAKSHYLLSSVEVAKDVHDVWQQERGGKTRIRQAPFFVVSSVNMPSILVEIGFLSNAKEAVILKDPREQEKIADTLYQAILKYKERMDKRKI